MSSHVPGKIGDNGSQKQIETGQHQAAEKKTLESVTPAGNGPARRRGALAPLFVVCLIILGSVVYLNTLNNQFVFDDIPLILDNPAIEHIERIPSRFTSGIHRIPYRPLRGISFAIDYQLTGLNPVGYHISNIFFHVLTVLLVYGIISALTGKPSVAFFAACLFAVHPVHADSVAYISGRRDILSTLFYLLGFYCFLVSRQRQKPRLLIPALVSYLLAISSKEMAVTLPVVFFLFDAVTNLPDEGPVFKRCSASLKKIISRYGVFYLFFLALALLFTGYKVFIKSPSNKIGFYGGDPVIQFLTVGKILVYYIKLLFYPVNLLADYSFNSFPLSQSFFEPATLLSVLVLCALGFLAVKLLATDRLMAFALIWFFVTLLPVCHIFPHHELLAEHYLYLPSFGFVLLSGLVLERLMTAMRRRYAVYAACSVLILLLSARTVDRNYDWRNSFTLWSKTVKTSPDCVRALNNLGIEYFKRKDYTRAEQLYRRALSVQPAYEKAFFNLGNLCRVREDYQSAIKMYQKAARLDPENFRNYNNLGNAFAMTGNYEEARRAFEKALQCKPRYAEAYNNLGNVNRSLGKIDKAITYYQTALRLKPQYEDACTNLVSTYLKLKQYEKAIQVLEQARSKNPTAPFVYKELGVVYEQSAQYDRAFSMYEQALELEPGSSEIHSYLGKLHARQRSYQKAIEHFQQALENEPSVPAPHLNLADLYLKKLNDKQKALYHLKAWIRKAPNDKRSGEVRKMIDQIQRKTKAME